MLRKLKAAVDAANTIQGYLLIGGDIFHRKGHAPNTPAMINDLIDVLSQARHTPIAIAGNHDISAGGTEDNLRTQTIGILEKAGVLILLDGTNPVQVKDNLTGITVSISGRSCISAMDEKQNAHMYNVKHANADIRIGMFHQMVLPDNVSCMGNYVQFEDLESINSDVVLTGHYHTGFEPAYVHGKHFVNPGSMGRVSVNETHAPSYVQILVPNENPADIIVRLHPFKGTQKSDTAFIRKPDAVQEGESTSIMYESNAEEIKSFVQSLDSFNAFNASEKTAADIVKMLISDYGMPIRLEHTAKQYLEAGN